VGQVINWTKMQADDSRNKAMTDSLMTVSNLSSSSPSSSSSSSISQLMTPVLLPRILALPPPAPPSQQSYLPDTV
jgi:hypothetical protein